MARQNGALEGPQVTQNGAPRPQIDPTKMMAIRQQAMEEILTLAEGAPPEQQEALVVERMAELEQELKQLEQKIAEETAKEMKQDIDDILKKLDHPHVCKLLELYDEPKYIYMLMELLPGGELYDRLTNLGNPMTEKEAA